MDDTFNLSEFFEHGQPHANRAAEIAASGDHSIMFTGAPGVGKSRYIQLILFLQQSPSNTVFKRNTPGVAPTYPTYQPNSKVWIAGEHLLDRNKTRFYADTFFSEGRQMLLECEPCDCGYYGDPYTACMCEVEAVERHQKILHPSFTQHIEMQIDLTLDTDRAKRHGEKLETVFDRVQNLKAHIRQEFPFSKEAYQLLDIFQRKAFATDTMIKAVTNVSNTICMMNGSYSEIMVHHVAEALQYQGKWSKR